MRVISTSGVLPMSERMAGGLIKGGELADVGLVMSVGRSDGEVCRRAFRYATPWQAIVKPPPGASRSQLVAR